ncbi:MAG: hypothetical protein VKO44_02385 [Cyanobacteriota bacterium]|jgi:hypothetical protein|nr:hypothetical protein [Cyanobacteriota bacterium]
MLAKRSALALALALLGATLGSPGQVLAQQQAPQGQANQSPATGEQFNTYMTMAAINMCALSQNKVAFKPAMESNLAMVTSVLTSKHGSKVVGAPAALTREQLINASVAETVIRIDRFCGKTLPADWKKDVDPLLSQVKQAVQSSGKAPK